MRRRKGPEPELAVRPPRHLMAPVVEDWVGPHERFTREALPLSLYMRHESELASRFRNAAHLRYRAALAEWVRDNPKVDVDIRAWRLVKAFGTPAWRDQRSFMSGVDPAAR